LIILDFNADQAKNQQKQLTIADNKTQHIVADTSDIANASNTCSHGFLDERVNSASANPWVTSCEPWAQAATCGS
jgi:hypothetical protein